MSLPDWLPLPSLPKNQEEMDKRSEKTRIFFAKSLQTYAGLSFKDQNNFRKTVSDTWSQFTEPVNAQRRNCQDSISLPNRYLLNLFIAIQPLIWFRRHRIRRAAFFWAAGSWFACPEWYRAYWNPSKSMIELLSEQQQNDGQKTTPPAPKSEQVAAKQEEAASVAVVKSAPASTHVQVNKTAAAAGSTSVEEMRKRAADRLAEEQRRLKEQRDREEQARRAAKNSAPAETKTTSTASSSASQSSSSNAPTPIFDAMRKRAQARIAQELKAKELKQLAALAEETERARKAAQNNAIVPVESKAKDTMKGSPSKETPTPIVNEMRKRAAARLAKQQQNRQ